MDRLVAAPYTVGILHPPA
ncbi:hypothetical protein EYZ11_003141 [Aspergillus tanneri]|uniref:Uncharacterized protein n=1 Tax=Aspergillus tanneri TaxID=1220188 RepID=A0A4S3JR45_9EURO|nr:hypothetical protein EYZ11_003141 [Aspergillus tanneri]